MATTFIVGIVLFLQIVIGYADNSVNLLVRSSNDTNVRRYCVALAKLPNGRTVNVTNFGWHFPYIASPSVNACNITDLADSLPRAFPERTVLIIYEHRCKITEHAWNVETLYGQNISLMILTNRTNTNYELSYNTTAMPVSITVLVFVQNDFNSVNKTYKNIENVEMSIDYAPILPRKFRPSVLLLFVLVLLILICGNLWAADEFIRKVQTINADNRSLSSNLNTTPATSDVQDNPVQEATRPKSNAKNLDLNKMPSNSEPPVIYMSCYFIIFLLCFAVGWLLLIFYFPRVMIYILQGFFCIGAFTSLTSCLDRLSYFTPKIRSFHIPQHTCQQPCTCKLGPLNVFTLFAMIVSLTVVIVWYVFRHADWGWVLQDILGIAICITITSVYRIGNMRIITLILLGFFFYDIFFVFITPYIPFFQPSSPKTTPMTTTTRPPITTTFGFPTGSMSLATVSYLTGTVYRKVPRNPSVMEQVALGIGTDGEVVPLLFAIPAFIPESEIDPCSPNRKSMLGFGDVILPGILLTFCKIFDIANGNRWPIYHIQSLISYTIGLSLTHVALYFMDTAQPALLYLVPCILLSTIITGLCRGELKELYSGKRIKQLLETKPQNSLLTNSDNSVEDQAAQSHDVIIGISDTIGAVSGVENR